MRKVTRSLKKVCLPSLVLAFAISVSFVSAETREDELFSAVHWGDSEKIVQLLKKGVDINTRNEVGRTPLMTLAFEGTVTLEGDEGDTGGIARLLISKGAIVDAKTKEGQTALMFAAQVDNKNVAEILISSGADVNAKDNNDKTTLMYAASFARTSTKTAELLISKGVDINAKDKDGRTALIWVAINGNKEIAKLLISKGVDLNVRDKDGRTALIFAEHHGYLESGGLLTGMTEDYKEIVRLLKEAGAE